LGYQFFTKREDSAFVNLRNADIYMNVIPGKQLWNSLPSAQFTPFYLSTTMLRSVFEIYSSFLSAHSNIFEWYKFYADFEFLDSSSI